MPEFLPSPQLPQGLAEEVIRLASQRGASSPWAALAQAGGQVAQGFAAHDQRQGPTLSPEQSAMAGFTGAPPGFQGPVQPGAVAKAFPRGVPLSLVEQMSKQREQEAIAKQRVEGTMGLEVLKATHTKELEAINAQHAQELAKAKANEPVEVNDIDKQNYKTAFGKDFPQGVSMTTAQRKQIADAAKAKTGSTDRAIAMKDSATYKETLAEKKQGLAEEKLWEGVNRAVNPINAPRGSLLGQAGQGNARADRALTTLSSKTVTPQQIDAVVADYAGIMQGGAPHELALRQMGYSNLADRWARFQQYWESKPKNVNTPEIKEQLRSMIADIKKVDNQIISQNLDTVEQTHGGLLKKDVERWMRIREQVLKGTRGPGEAGGKGKYEKLSDAELLKQLGQ